MAYGAAGKSLNMGGTIRGGNRTGGVATSGGGSGPEYGSDGNSKLPTENGHPKGHYSGNVVASRITEKSGKKSSYRKKGTMA
jgi:hypothetical protein